MYPIPANATRIRYLESTGTQYVDTGVDLVNGDTFTLEVDGRYTSLLSRYQLMGVYASSYFGVNPNNRWIVAGGDGFDTANADTSRHAFALRSTIGGTQTSYLTIDGASYSRSRTNAAGRIYLLNIPASGQTWTCAFAVYSARLTVNGILVRSFVPVRVGQTGYLFDRVSGQLFGNAGTGDFVLGPDTFQQGVVPTRMMAMGVRKKAKKMRCAVFDGTKSSVMECSVGSLSDTAYPSVSVAMWQRIDQYTPNGWPFTFSSTNSNRTGVIFGLSVGGSASVPPVLRCQFSYIGDFGSYNTGSYGEWHHVAFSFSNGTLSMYSDGNLIHTGSSSKWMNTTASMFVSLGSRPTLIAQSALVGKIANVNIFLRGISSGEIATLASGFDATIESDHQYLFANDDGTDTGASATKWNLTTGSTTTFEDV